MFKLAGAVVDFYDDPDFFDNPDAQDLLGKVLIPPEQMHKRPDREFAVKIASVGGIHRKFPIYNRAATMLSGSYFQKIAADLPENIRDVAGFFLKRAHFLFSLPLPEALCQPFPTPDGNEAEFVPEQQKTAASAEDLVKVAEYAFVDQARGMHVLEKVEQAAQIHKVAEKTGQRIEEQEVWDYVPKDSWGPHIGDALRQREVRVNNDPMIKEAWVTILGEIQEVGPIRAPFLVYEFDKMAGFDEYGPGKFVDPFYAFWGGFSIPKEAAGPEATVLDYKLGTIARNRGVLEQALPMKFVDRFVRDPKAGYSEASPAQRKFIDFLMGKIPSNVREGDTEPTRADGRSRPAELHKEIDQATEGLKQEQDSPSERPDKHRPGTRGIFSEIDEGL